MSRLEMADWSKLPYDLIHKIASHLSTIEDFLAFSSACSSWRSVYLVKEWHHGPQVPCLMLSSHENSSFRRVISLNTNKVFKLELPEARGKRCWGSSSGWLVTLGNNYNVCLLNPFTRISLTLPSQSTLPRHFGEVLDWYDSIERAFIFQMPHASSYTNEEDLLVIVIYGCLKQLAFCRPGYSSWKGIENTSYAGFIDIACIKDQIYALCDWGSLVIVDIECLAIVDINGPLHPIRAALSLPWWKQLSLVESSGELWIVCQNHNSRTRISSIESTRFSIYNFDFNEKEWIRVTDLGHHAIFVGDNCSMSIPVTEHMSCKKNNIYFVQKQMAQQNPYREVHVDLGMYSMTSGMSEPHCFASDVRKSCSFPIWFTPSLY